MLGSKDLEVTILVLRVPTAILTRRVRARAGPFSVCPLTDMPTIGLPLG